MLYLLFLAASLVPSLVTAQSCNATSLCGASAPCCSEFGFCGTGTYCLGGCNPIYSHTVTSCEPAPICQDKTYTFLDNSRIINSTLYNGNASAYDFTLDNGAIYNLNSSIGELALLLTQTNGGTRISTTRYMQYGSVTARMKTSKWAGVVTAFITMSDVKDEIDWEWPGANTTQAQSNFFWLGHVNYTSTNGQKESISNDSYSNYHDYTINWQENQLDFSIDGNVVRSVKKTDTLDPSGIPEFPTTPARVQISIWPAGINTSAPGTVQWAGGMINWSDPDYSAAGGHFAAVVNSVKIKCGTSSNTTVPNTPRSYVYSGNNSQGVPQAYISNATTILNSGGVASRLAVKTATLWAGSLAASGLALGMLFFA